MGNGIKVHEKYHIFCKCGHQKSVQKYVEESVGLGYCALLLQYIVTNVLQKMAASIFGVS